MKIMGLHDFNKKIKLNKKFVDEAALPVNKDQVFYRDSELKGFALRVTSSSSKSFVVEKTLAIKSAV